ncbi:MAG: type II secretion system F family protein [Nanoarchaeota archaeon]
MKKTLIQRIREKFHRPKTLQQYVEEAREEQKGSAPFKKKGKKSKPTAKEKRLKFEDYLETAGYGDLTARALLKFILIAAGIILAGAYFGWFVSTWSHEYGLFYHTWMAVVFLLVGYPASVLTTALIFYVYTDMRITSRKNSIEKVLPEFLHLTAANVRAGMPIDQALWSAIRPRFGILSKEMELVAKQNMIGEDLEEALLDFATKYDSKMLRRSVSLINEGLEAGSEIGDLLENIALSIQDIEMRKESMAANVTAYIIFITFSVLFAAPLLFAVSIQLLRIVHVVGESISGGDGGSTGINISLSSNAVNESDFFIFCLVSILVTTVMSAVIIAGIKGQKPIEALKHVPVYSLVAMAIFFVAQWLLGIMFASVF